MRMVLSAVTLIAAMALELALALGPSQAFGNAPWCTAVAIGHSVVKSCYYRTFEECYPNILGGNRGFCEQNPDWYGRNIKAAAHKRHRKHHVNRD
ncbi:MAG TPA: DUF3551 domain-containing protein [Pseudolabrys sp.]